MMTVASDDHHDDSDDDDDDGDDDHHDDDDDDDGNASSTPILSCGSRPSGRSNLQLLHRQDFRFGKNFTIFKRQDFR